MSQYDLKEYFIINPKKASIFISLMKDKYYYEQNIFHNNILFIDNIMF